MSKMTTFTDRQSNASAATLSTVSLAYDSHYNSRQSKRCGCGATHLQLAAPLDLQLLGGHLLRPTRGVPGQRGVGSADNIQAQGENEQNPPSLATSQCICGGSIGLCASSTTARSRTSGNPTGTSSTAVEAGGGSIHEALRQSPGLPLRLALRQAQSV